MNLLQNFIKLKGILLIGLIMLALGLPLHATWLENVPFTVVQPNGDTLHLFATGDEYYNFLHDAEGYTILLNTETGYYVYAVKVNNRLVASNYVYGTINPLEKGITPRLTISDEEYYQRRQEWERRMPHNRTEPEPPNHGILNNIVVFVRFLGQPEFEQSYSSINQMFNDESTEAVSLVNYFDHASWGDIHIPSHLYPSPDGDIIISYQDPFPRDFYRPKTPYNLIGYEVTGDEEVDLVNKHDRAMILLRGVVGYIKNMIPNNLDLDFNIDGKVDNIVLVIKGNFDVGNLLWPSRWNTWELYEDLMINDKYVFDFNYQFADSDIFHVGVLCHEMNHTLGAPDIYHRQKEGGYGNLYPVWTWDLQSIEDDVPQQHTAYMKMKYDNWIANIPDITDNPGTYTLNALAGPTRENVAYKIRSSDPNQFFVLEYRNKDLLFDSHVPGKGMIICRVDTRYNGNINYNPPENIYDEIFVFRLGGSPSNYNGDPDEAYFSAQCGRTSFNVNTDPYPYLTNGMADRSISIFDISEAGNTITFTYGYKIEASSNNEQGGTVTGGGLFAYNSTCTLTATPNPGYIFKGWYLPSGLLPINPLPTFTFNVTSNMNLVAKFQPATPTTDVYQYYCWFDQDYSTVQTGSFQTTETFFALDASALSEGIHTLHVMLDDNGLTAPKTYLFLKTPEVLPVSSYNYHCWFDQDYSTVQTGTFGGEGYSFALDANELEEGIHTVHVMLEGNDLSASKTYMFLKAPVASSTETYTYHCWFDQDYSTVQTGTFGGEGYSFALDASELEEGIHTMHVMLEGGELTAAKTYLFLKAPVASPTSTYTYHCWFDQDYTTVQTGTFGGEGYSFALDVDGLDNGLHFVNVMLEGNELTSAKRYLFCKKPVGGSGIYRWEYCLNSQWSDAVVTNLVPTVQTLDILTMLPVDHLPIRSEDFEFDPNGGQPEIYAKNTITFRFWDDENRFLDRSAVYVDATVHEPVMADWIQRNTTETIATPAANHIHWFKLDAEVGDSLAFKSDVYCTMELFAPSGARQFKVMNAASVAFNGICANESGIYYLAVHDVEGSYENVSVTYLFLREMTAVTALNAGWNWWTPTVWTDISTLQSTLSDYLIQIQVQDEMPTGNINPGKMLKIQTSAACALSLRGMPITAASITVNPGATWFGYIGEEAPITQALNGFPPSLDDKIISQDGGFAVYNGTEWEGTLTTLEPGKGYVYVSTAAWSKTIVFE